MIRIKKQTYQEKVDMYMKLSKKELVDILIQSNKYLAQLQKNKN